MQVRAEERRWRRGDLAAVLGALMLGVVLAWIVLTIQAMGHDLRYERDYNRALARQVEGLGGTPVAGPSGARGEPGLSVTGEPGRDGRDGKDAPTLTPSPGPSGASGAPGRPGADSTVPGPSGEPGADSTVPGPSGAPGRDGIDGRDGTDGVDGEPPVGWTWTDRFGDTYSCERVDGFDPESPRYGCPRDEPPDDSPGQSGSLAAGLDPRRIQYA